MPRSFASAQVHLIGDELWGGYPAWRRVNGVGRLKRNGVREVSEEMAQEFADKEAERRTKTQQSLGIRVLKPIKVEPSEDRTVPSQTYISGEDHNLFMGQAALRHALTRQSHGTMQLRLQHLHVWNVRQILRHADICCAKLQ